MTQDEVNAAVDKHNAECEQARDLFWHALNYRTAAPQHAQQMWLELEKCVKLLIEDALDNQHLECYR
jgi:hypothetical protein